MKVFNEHFSLFFVKISVVIITRLHLYRHPFYLLHLSPLVSMTKMAVNAQPTAEESRSGVTEKRGSCMWQGDSGLPDNTSHIIFMLTVELENLDPPPWMSLRQESRFATAVS